jgi:hypothetical protein
MNSKEVHYIISQWTKNPLKIQSLMAWLVEMSEEAVETPVAIQKNSVSTTKLKQPMALELPRLSAEVCHVCGDPTSN